MYFVNNIELQVLLVTSSRRPDNWIVPGGGVEPNEEPSCTAVREVLEEAGVVGTLGRCLGMFEVNLTKKIKLQIIARFKFSEKSNAITFGHEIYIINLSIDTIILQ